MSSPECQGFELREALDILRVTPVVLHSLLGGMSPVWIEARETQDSWNAHEIVGHLIHGERTDWIPRLKQILDSGDERPFEEFDRFVQLKASKQQSTELLLAEFSSLRSSNLTILEGLELTPEASSLPGQHPEFGAVTLGQLLSAWVVHDLGHLAQISRAMAARYRNAVGPWRGYLPVLG
ncbi:MAG: DinB family protein [bacterium]|nr:DinB family protein [bacterium]